MMQQENLGQSVSLWMATTAVPNRSTLVEDAHADVCVVGAGIAGITTAYLLAKQGKSVIVLDDGALGGGQTQRTTAQATKAQSKGQLATPVVILILSAAMPTTRKELRLEIGWRPTALRSVWEEGSTCDRARG